MVNIPQFLLVARENGKDVMDIRVVVGKPGHNTPIFSDEMETVVLSPYWNIPDSIAEGETAPAHGARIPDTSRSRTSRCCACRATRSTVVKRRRTWTGTTPTP